MIPWRKIRRASSAIVLVILLGCFVFVEFNLQLRPRVRRSKSRTASGRLSDLLELQKSQQNGELVDGKSGDVKRTVNSKLGSFLALEKRVLHAKLDFDSNSKRTGEQQTPGFISPTAIAAAASRTTTIYSPSVTQSASDLSKILAISRVKTSDVEHISTSPNQFPALTKYRKTELKDIFISVKTTYQFHKTRVQELLQTWVGLARNQVYFFTDDEDKETVALGVNLINTKCPSGHQRSALCCKMAAEFNYYLEKVMSRWFCHFDDDNYVNVPTLVETLRKYNHTDDVYLGKISLSSKMEVYDRDDPDKLVSFWFATGGAGFCLSKSLIEKMVPYVRGVKFMDSCDRTHVPDDCTIGFITEWLLGVKLTELQLFHSHLESLPIIPQHEFSEQISFSHGNMGGRYNHIQINGPFSEDEDPSRFKSLHCFLFPETKWCPDKVRNEQ